MRSFLVETSCSVSLVGLIVRLHRGHLRPGVDEPQVPRSVVEHQGRHVDKGGLTRRKNTPAIRIRRMVRLGDADLKFRERHVPAIMHATRVLLKRSVWKGTSVLFCELANC